jgi:hypothetical protein
MTSALDARNLAELAHERADLLSALASEDVHALLGASEVDLQAAAEFFAASSFFAISFSAPVPRAASNAAWARRTARFIQSLRSAWSAHA